MYPNKRQWMGKEERGSRKKKESQIKMDGKLRRQVLEDIRRL